MNTLGKTALCLGLLLGTQARAGLNEWTTAGPASTINAVSAHPQLPARLYAAGTDGLYRSPDQGRTWENVRGPLLGRSVLSLAVDPEAGDRLWAGTNAGLYFSADAGSSWTKAARPAAGVLSLAAGAGGRVWAGTFGQGIFRSADRGLTWEAGEGVMAQGLVFCLAAAPGDSLRVYAGTAEGLYASRDGGRTWAAAGTPLQGLSVRAILLFPDPGLLLVGTFGAGIFKSADGGQSWVPLNNGLDDLSVRGLAAEAGSTAVLYAATSTRGFYRSRDGGLQWRAFSAGLPGLSTRSVLADPAKTGRVLGGGPGTGVWIIDSGAQPHLEVARRALDFGTVAVGGQQVLRLRLANSGTATLRVSRLSVGRTPPFAVSPSRLDLAPGAEASVEVRFTPQQRGIERDTLKIRSGDPEAGLTALPLQGSAVEAELSLTPGSLDFGQVWLSGFRDTTVVLGNVGTAALALRSAAFDSSAFEVVGFKAQSLGPGQQLSLRVRFRPARIGLTIGRLSVVSDASRRPRGEVAVRGTGSAPVLSADPVALDFGTGQLQRPKTLVLELSNSGNSPLSIQGLRLGGESFQVQTGTPLLLGPGEVRRLEVVFLPRRGGEHLDTLEIAGDAALLRVPLKGSSGALALRPRAPIAAGQRPADLVAMDLNGDGHQDLATADAGSGQILVLLNDGSGIFPRARQALYPPGEEDAWDEPVALDAAPIFANAPDLVVADRVARSLSLLANDGQGRFAGRRQDFFIGHAVADVHAADLDADGDVDLAVADGDTPSLTVLYNNGQGTFNVRTSYAVDGAPSALGSANLDEDGHRDLVVANRDAGTVSVLRNNRQGGFQPHQEYAVGAGPGALVLVDFDADGDEDLFAADQDSRDVAPLLNDGQGRFTAGQRLSVQASPVDLALADLTADIFSDLVVASTERPYGVFWENEGGKGFSARDTLATDRPLRRVAVLDLDGDGSSDIAGLSATAGSLQVFINADTTRRQDQPRPPTRVRAQDAPRDLGRRIEVLWEAPELDEKIRRTTEYTIFRSAAEAGPFSRLGRAVAGARRFVDNSAALGDTFYYYVQAGNAVLQSLPSDTVGALSQPSPFFELEVVDEARLSVGDTLKVKAFITPAGQGLAGVSLYLSFGDSTALALIPDDSAGAAPFRLAAGLGSVAVLENRLHFDDAHLVDVSLGGLRVKPGVSPVLLGELWFLSRGNSLAYLAIDDQPARNRQSAVVAAGTGEWLLPFIADTTRLAIRDFSLKGRVRPEGFSGPLDLLQVTFSLVDARGEELQSPLNDEDRLRPGIQHTLDAGGNFHLAQIPRGRYQVSAKPPSHLQGRVLGDTVSVGDSLVTQLEFRWVGADSTASLQLPAGDANGDNQINLADFGLLVRYFGATPLHPDWARARLADFDGSGEVNFDDFGLLAQNFGRVGMGARGTSRKERVGIFRQEGAVVRMEGELPISGFAAHGKGLEIELAGSRWEGEGLVLRRWQEGDQTHLAGALGEGGRSAGSGVLFSVRAGTVEELEILREDGQVLQLEREGPRPLASALLPNYPNPFNPSTLIPFAVGGAGAAVVPVRLEIYDLLGQRARTLVAGAMVPGEHAAVWDGRDQQGREVGAGVYCCRLQAGDFVQTRRLLLLR